MARYLLSRGASTEVRNSRKTVLLACYRHENCGRNDTAVLSAGADPNARNTLTELPQRLVSTRNYQLGVRDCSAEGGRVLTVSIREALESISRF